VLLLSTKTRLLLEIQVLTGLIMFDAVFRSGGAICFSSSSTSQDPEKSVN